MHRVVTRVRVLAGAALVWALLLGALWMPAQAVAVGYAPVGVWRTPTSLSEPTDVVTAMDGEVFIADSDGSRIVVLGPDGSWRRSFDGSDVYGESLLRPASVAIGPDARVYVCDSSANRVSVFERDGAFVTSWGRYGSGNGELASPQALAFSSAGEILVVEQANNRVQVFSSAGVWSRSFGGPSSSLFNGPSGVAVVGSEVFVTEAFERQVKVTNLSGGVVRAFGITLGGPGTPTTTRYLRPSGITPDPSGGVLVVDAGRGVVEKCSVTGVVAATWTGGASRILIPEGVWVDTATDPAGTMLVADTGNNRIQRMNRSNSTWSTPWSFSSSSGALGSYSSPRAVAYAPDGSIYVADTGNKRVQRLDAAGDVVAEFGASVLATPTGIAVSADGNEIYVADSGTSRIQAFSAAGNLLRTMGAGSLTNPEGVCVAPDGGLAVADTGGDRVVRMSSSGTLITIVGSGILQAPAGVVYGQANELVVADTQHHRIVVFDATGAELRTLGSFGSGVAQLTLPQQIGVMPNGDLLVADRGNSRLQRYKATGAHVERYGVLGSGWGKHRTPYGVCVAPDGTISVADTGNDRVVKWGIDTLAPHTDIRGDITAWVSSPVTITLEPGDAGSGVGITYYRLGAGTRQRYTGPFVITAEGSTQIQYLSVDRAGNAEATHTALARVDRIPPVGTLVLGSGASVIRSMIVTAHASVTGATEMRYDYGTGWTAWVPYSNTYSVLLPQEGPQVVRGQYRDLALNTLESSATVTADVSGPAVSTWGLPAGGVTADPVTLSLTAADAYLAVASLRYSVDGGAEQEYAGEFVVDGISDHVVTAYAVDSLGNVGPTTTARFRILGHPPEGTWVVAGGRYWLPSTTFEFTTDIVRATEMRFDTGYETRFTAWMPFAASGTLTIPGPGEWQIAGEFRDAVGRTLHLDGVVGYDNAEPMSIALGLPTSMVDGRPTSGEPVTVTLEATDDLSGVAEVLYRVDGGAAKAYSAPFTVSGDGTHTVSWRAMDGAGNAEPWHDTLFVVAENFPIGTMKVAGGRTWINTSTVVIESNITHATRMRFDFGRGEGFGDWMPFARTITTTYGAEGRYLIQGHYRDLMGRVYLRTGQVTVDLTAPTVQLLGLPQGGVSSGPVLIAVTATDALSPLGDLTYRVDGGPPRRYTSPFVVSGDGSHTVEAYAQDGAGNICAPVTARFTIAGAGPSGSMILNGGNPVTNRSTVTVESNVVGATQVRFDTGSGFGPWRAYEPTLTVDLPEEGLRVVTAAYRTSLGTERTLMSTILVDRTPASLSRPLLRFPTVDISGKRVRWDLGVYATAADGGVVPSGVDFQGFRVGRFRAVTTSSAVTLASVPASGYVTGATATDRAENSVQTAGSVTMGVGTVVRLSAASMASGSTLKVSGSMPTPPSGASYRLALYKRVGTTTTWKYAGSVAAAARRSGSGVSLTAKKNLFKGAWRVAWQACAPGGASVSRPSGVCIVK